MHARVSGPPRFFFLGDDLALDFANTVVFGKDLLAGRLKAWLRAAGLKEGGGRGGREALRLRDAIRAAAEALARGKRAPRGAALGIDGVLRANPGSLRLRAGRLAFEPRRAHPLAPVAEAAARLLTGPGGKLVRRCGNPACALYFIDGTRNRSRRWCSMEVCGNRTKVAAWRARHR